MSEQFNINEDAQSGGEYSGSRSSFNEEPVHQPNPESSAFPDEDEETITMLDVIEREDKLEEEASAVLGNSDPKNCTYPKGYISRQALYSCATCSDGSDNHAAICLACSLECHDNHEVYELYTKRNYRCDCGNSKFKADFECKLMDKQQKSSLNDKNKYNHNFKGRYCVCDKRYPPDENDHSPESNDEMWQCIVCEDWYHSKHLEAKEEELPSKFEEMVCHRCAPKLPFLYHYRNIDNLDANSVCKAITSDTDQEEDAEQEDDKTDELVKQNEQLTIAAQTTSTTTDNSSAPQKTDTICESDTNDSQAENKDPGLVVKQPHEQQPASTTSSTTECTLEKLKQAQEEESSSSSSSTSDSKQNTSSGPIFWSDCNWRSKLCRCQKCVDMYKKEDCEYLLDDQDTVHYYEAQGKATASNSETPLERGMSALNRMNRAAVVEALHGYDELKADLSDYLRKFADTKKVVREEDIHEFFQQLKSKKRPRFE